MKKNKIAFVTMLVLTSTLTCSYAHSDSMQEQQKALSNAVDKLCEDAKNIAVDKIKPHIIDYPEIAEKKNLVSIIPSIEFNAYAAYEKRRIFLTKNICVQLFLMSRGMMLSDLYELPPSYINGYIVYLGEVAEEVERKAAVGTYIEYEINPFEIYANLDLTKLSSQQKRTIDGVIIDEMPNLLMSIIGHEIAHLVLDHQPYNKISSARARLQEIEADQFAFKLVSEIFGAPPDPALFTMPLGFMTAREKGVVPKSRRTHPRPECRLVELYDRTDLLTHIQNDPEMEKTFTKNTGVSVEEFEEAMSVGLEECREDY